MGCVSQVGEQALNVARMSLLVAGWPGPSAARPSTASAARRCRRPSTPPPPSRRGISTSSSPRASSRCLVSRWDRTSRRTASRASRRSSTSTGRSSPGHLRRGDRRRVGPVARGTRRVLVRVASTRDRGDRRRALRARDRAGRGRGGGRGRARRHRREPAPRHVAREARVAQARVQGGRKDHSGQLERDRRRRSGHARDEEAAADRLGLEPRARCLVRSPGVDPYRMLQATRSPASARSQGRAQLGRHGRDRGQRSLRVGRAPVPEGHRVARALGGR